MERGSFCAQEEEKKGTDVLFFGKKTWAKKFRKVEKRKAEKQIRMSERGWKAGLAKKIHNLNSRRPLKHVDSK